MRLYACVRMAEKIYACICTSMAAKMYTFVCMAGKIYTCLNETA